MSRFSALGSLPDGHAVGESTAQSPRSDGEPSDATSIPRNGQDPDTAGQPPVRLKQPLVWLDLEMTGLDVDTDTILEIACCVTSGDLRRVMEGPTLAIQHSSEVLSRMNDWCKETHAGSGLIERCRSSEVNMEAAEEEVLQFVQRHCRPGRVPLAGNTVHVDKAFLRVHMPRLHGFLHFRIVDVSSVNEIVKRWMPSKLALMPEKKRHHTAMEDIKESIEELRFYRHRVFEIHDRAICLHKPYDHRFNPDATPSSSSPL